MQEDWERLQQQVRIRIQELDLKQSEIQDRGGPSPAKVREIINGRSTSLSTSKRRDLERALEWREGSIDAVLAGGDPTTTEPTEAELTAQIAQLRAEVSKLDEKASQSNGPSREARKASMDLLGQLASAEMRLHLTPRTKAYAEHSVLKQQQDQKLVDLWLLTEALSHPDLLDTDELLDAAVELAQAVASYTVKAVGGYTRMQQLAEQRRNELDNTTGQQTIYDEMNRLEEINDDMEAPTQSDAPAEGDQDEEVQRQLEQSDLDLAARDIGYESMGRQIRRKQDEEAEDPA